MHEYIYHHFCAESGVCLFQAPFCAYAAVTNETHGTSILICENLRASVISAKPEVGGFLVQCERGIQWEHG